ncbi:hypothetical protein J1N35_001420 [Gossypium stocksii]|uniref:Uncharacterized protein n=1 Tax=Gossypium stocksii TaxID=47602 RepID=A0A9D3WIW5_9ROSI|nr:hypothetical protein J1N35_001420 [Gossypium stocksii]
MAKISQALFIEHYLWSWALENANNHYNRKIADLEKAVKISEEFMDELRRVHQESTNLIGRLDACIITLKGKYKDAQTECEQLKESVNQLKVENYTFKEKLKA